MERLSTGNEFVSIPDISTTTAGIEDIGFLHSAFRACIEMHGSETCPLLKPVVEVGGKDLFAGEIKSERVSHWIPQFSVSADGVKAVSRVYAPLDRRGFVCLLSIENTSESAVTLNAGWHGCWESSYHAANLAKRMVGVKHGSMSSWRPGVPVVEYRGHTPLFAIAFVSHEIVPARVWSEDTQTESTESTEWTGESVSATAGRPIYYELADEYALGPSEKIDLPIYIGVGLEEVSAVASAQELQIQGWERTLTSLKNWLNSHTIECNDEYFKELLNVNSFYNYFFSQGIALDTEELVVTTGRSSRNNACAAYWDRDAMRWSLPAMLQINWPQGRRMLSYAFTTQLQNVGVHSRFIDGIVLEPGLQLDQLCAPIRALVTYVQLTGDISVLFDRRIQTGVNTIQQILGAQRHPEVALFETLLLPSGEPSKFPYLCYSNVLVWRILQDIRWLYDRIRDLDRADEANALSTLVRDAIMKHFVVEGPSGEMFAHGIDLEGGYELGDDPAGSLRLLTHFRFCSPEDAVYRNTVEWIHSEHNPRSNFGHAFAAPLDMNGSGPSVVGVITDLFTSRKDEALEFLRRAPLDDGIACETVDSETGQALTGKASASCAGYLAFGLRQALNAALPVTSMVGQKRRVSETLYEPPPEISQDSKKARM